MKIKEDNQLMREMGIDIVNFEDSHFTQDKITWTAPELLELVEIQKRRPFMVDVRGLYTGMSWDQSIRGMVERFQRVYRADLNHPIILNADGRILDGVSRVMKTILLGKSKIKAVKLLVNIQDMEKVPYVDIEKAP